MVWPRFAVTLLVASYRRDRHPYCTVEAYNLAASAKAVYLAAAREAVNFVASMGNGLT